MCCKPCPTQGEAGFLNLGQKKAAISFLGIHVCEASLAVRQPSPAKSFPQDEGKAPFLSSYAVGRATHLHGGTPAGRPHQSHRSSPAQPGSSPWTSLRVGGYPVVGCCGGADMPAALEPVSHPNRQLRNYMRTWTPCFWWGRQHEVLPAWHSASPQSASLSVSSTPEHLNCTSRRHCFQQASNKLSLIFISEVYLLPCNAIL